MTVRNAVAAILVMLVAGLISACLDDAGAQSGSFSQAEYEALLARVEALESRNMAFAAEGSTGMSKATSDGKELGSALAFNSVPQASTQVTLKSALGYLYTVDLNGVNGLTGPTNHEIFYESGNCSGQGYISGVSDYGANQGYVFAITNNGGTTWDDPAQFYYIPAGSVRTGPITFNSRRASIEELCVPSTGTEQVAYPVLPNDPAVTGVDGSPIKTPITLG